jgi:hypothetical protein
MSATTSLCVFARALFEHRNDARLTATGAFADELRGQDRLSRSRRSRDEDGISRRNAAAHHLVEPGHSDRQPRRSLLRLARAGDRWGENESRKHLNAVVGDAKGMQAGNRRLTAHLHDLHLPHHGVPVKALIQPREAVRDRKNGMVLSLAQLKLADKKGRRLPAGQPHAQFLDEVLQVELLGLPFCHLHHRSKRVDDHDAG